MYRSTFSPAEAAHQPLLRQLEKVAGHGWPVWRNSLLRTLVIQHPGDRRVRSAENQ
jgi:hypothetical protein